MDGRLPEESAISCSSMFGCYDDDMETSVTNQKTSPTKLLGAFILPILLCFGGLLRIRHIEAQHLFAAGFAAWGNTSFDIRIVPGHSLSLVQKYTTSGDIEDALIPSVVAGLVGLWLAFLWPARLRIFKNVKAALVVLLITAIPSSLLAYAIFLVITPPPHATINLDANTISGTDLGPSPLNQISSFGCAIVNGRRSSTWVVGVQTLNGGEFTILPIFAAPTFQDGGAIPTLIAQTLSDFIVSHGTKFPAVTD